MKIAFFTDTYFPQMNGVSISISNYAKMLRTLGHTVYIFAPLIPGSKKEAGVIRLPSLKVLSAEPDVRVPIPKLAKEYQRMFNVDLDIVHAHGNGAFSLLGMQIARMRTIPFVMTFHTLHTKYGHYIFQGKVLTKDMIVGALRVFGNGCDGLLTPSSKMKQELVRYGIKKPIKVQPNFIFYDEFEKASPGFLRKKFNIPHDHIILLTVGRLGKEKNFSFLIGVTKKLQAYNPNIHLVIVGKGPDENLLKEQAKRAHISDHVHITGQLERDTVASCYRDSDIFVFASKTETQGIVVLEAAATKRPLVVVDDSAFDGIAVDKQDGFRLPLRQEIFAQHIKKLIADKPLQRQFGQQGQQLLHQNFDPLILTQSLLSFYEETIRLSSRKRPIIKQFFNRTTLNRFNHTLTAISNFFVVK